MLFPQLEQSAQAALNLIPQIPTERKLLLEELVVFVVRRAQSQKPIRTNTICTHNSRRSHLGQVWIAAMAEYFEIPGVEAFSGGTEATACHPHTIAALRAQGFEIQSNATENNPLYTVSFAPQKSTLCWSKRYDDSANPSEDFAAIMVCGSADGACPFVPGATLRLSCTYVDPKVSDGTSEQDATYQARSLQIASEMAYVMQRAAEELRRSKSKIQLGALGTQGSSNTCTPGGGCC
jgi:arsenate reductase